MKGIIETIKRIASGASREPPRPQERSGVYVTLPFEVVDDLRAAARAMSKTLREEAGWSRWSYVEGEVSRLDAAADEAEETLRAVAATHNRQVDERERQRRTGQTSTAKPTIYDV